MNLEEAKQILAKSVREEGDVIVSHGELGLPLSGTFTKEELEALLVVHFPAKKP